jgi:hypothetical protein
MTRTINTCRFCHEAIWGSDPSVKYGTRHYAHPVCYLDAGKTLQGLSLSNINGLPYFLLKERGLLEQAEQLVAERKALQARRQHIICEVAQ